MPTLITHFFVCLTDVVSTPHVQESKSSEQFNENKIRQEMRKLADLVKAKEGPSQVMVTATGHIAHHPTSLDAISFSRGTVSKHVLPVKIGVVACSRLLSSRSTSCNPWVSICLGSVRKQTHVLSNTIDPHWSESFSFEWNKSGEDTTSVIVFTVFNRENMARDTCLGTVELNLVKILELGGSIDDWFALKLPSGARKQSVADFRGSIKLRLNIAASAHSY